MGDARAVEGAGRAGEQIHPNCMAQSNEMRLHGCFTGASAALPCTIIVAQSSPIPVCPALARGRAINCADGIAWAPTSTRKAKPVRKIRNLRRTKTRMRATYAQLRNPSRCRRMFRSGYKKGRWCADMPKVVCWFQFRRLEDSSPKRTTRVLKNRKWQWSNELVKNPCSVCLECPLQGSGELPVL